MVPWILFGYAFGSVPFAFLLARRAGIDIRVAGSGNVGAANVLRTTGMPFGVIVMTLDISKGVATVLLASAPKAPPQSMAAAGAAAIVGHIYPVWLRFHGGKGVAVAAGVFSVLAPVAAVIAAAVFLPRCGRRGSSPGFSHRHSDTAVRGVARGSAAFGRDRRRRRGCPHSFRHRANVRRILPAPSSGWGCTAAIGGREGVAREHAHRHSRRGQLGHRACGSRRADRPRHPVMGAGRVARRPDRCGTRQNDRYLPGVRLDDRVTATASLESCAGGRGCRHRGDSVARHAVRPARRGGVDSGNRGGDRQRDEGTRDAVRSTGCRR